MNQLKSLVLAFFLTAISATALASSTDDGNWTAEFFPSHRHPSWCKVTHTPNVIIYNYYENGITYTLSGPSLRWQSTDPNEPYDVTFKTDMSREEFSATIALIDSKMHLYCPSVAA